MTSQCEGNVTVLTNWGPEKNTRHLLMMMTIHIRNKGKVHRFLNKRVNKVKLKLRLQGYDCYSTKCAFQSAHKKKN